MIPLAVLLIAYLLGAIPFGYLLVKWKTGADVRTAGSGNIGATNVMRTTGRATGIVTLLLDIAKGYAAVWIAGRLTGHDVLWMSLAAPAVMAGRRRSAVSGCIGGVSWGTALAVVLAPRFCRVKLWVYEADLAVRMAVVRINDIYLPDCPIPTNVDVTSDLTEALDGAEIVLSVMPSHLARGLYQRMLPNLNESVVFVSATKGLENHSLMRVTEVIREVVGTSRVAVLSGPTFARAVARF